MWEREAGTFLGAAALDHTRRRLDASYRLIRAARVWRVLIQGDPPQERRPNTGRNIGTSLKLAWMIMNGCTTWTALLYPRSTLVIYITPAMSAPRLGADCAKGCEAGHREDSVEPS